MFVSMKPPMDGPIATKANADAATAAATASQPLTARQRNRKAFILVLDGIIMALTAYSVALRLRSSWYSLDIVIVNAVLLIWAALCFYGVYNDKTGYMKANIGLFALFAAAYVVLGILSVIYGGNLGFAFVSLVFAAIAVSAATATWRHLKSFDTVTTTATATVIQPPYTV